MVARLAVMGLHACARTYTGVRVGIVEAAHLEYGLGCAGMCCVVAPGVNQMSCVIEHRKKTV